MVLKSGQKIKNKKINSSVAIFTALTTIFMVESPIFMVFTRLVEAPRVQFSIELTNLIWILKPWEKEAALFLPNISFLQKILLKSFYSKLFCHVTPFWNLNLLKWKLNLANLNSRQITMVWLKTMVSALCWVTSNDVCSTGVASAYCPTAYPK